MDAFYASVEQRDNPDLKGKPVIVGGDPRGRGVVATCSYEARKFGIHSAMSAARAFRLCPEAIFVRPRFPVYRQVSQQIRDIFLSYTDLVEPLSLDEAYLDVSTNKAGVQSATWIAQEIRRKISEQTKLTASAGVSYNKFLAKIASDVHKPNGLTVVTPAQAADFIAQLPIRRFHGVGRVTERKMKRLGIHCGADLLKVDLDDLIRAFGKAGAYYFYIARGIDERPVVPDRVRKSIGKETTLGEDLAGRSQMMTIIGDLANRVAALLESAATNGLTLTLKVKYSDFQTVTRSISHDEPIASAEDIIALAEDLLDKTEAGQRSVRLLGITISNLTSDIVVDDAPQLELPFNI